MRLTSSAVLASLTATCLFSSTDALSLHRRQDGAPPRVVSLKLHRSVIQDPIEHDRNRLRRRSGTLSATLDNLQTLYFLNASLGTPPQNVRLHLDTGSSDLWVNTPNSTLCDNRSSPCALSGTYTANSSSTYDYVGSYFNVTYADGSGAAGDYATDTIAVSGSSMAGFQFGIGYVSSSAQNIAGIGYAANEVQAARSGLKPYDNLPAKMVSDGLTAANAYSLWLDDLNSTTGSILFGGVDQSKYVGDLVTLPVQKVAGQYSEFFITMTGLSIGSATVAENMALGVLLDSGSSLTYLPNNMASDIFAAVNATYQETEGVAFVPCSLGGGSSSGNLTFRFSSPASITVPISELVLGILESEGSPLKVSDGSQACLFGIAPSGSSTSVLGDTFLRSAYVVYDLDSNEISLAQSNFAAGASDVVEITSGETALPSAVAAATPVAAQSGIPGTEDEESGAGFSGWRPELFSVVLAGVMAGLVVFAGNLS